MDELLLFGRIKLYKKLKNEKQNVNFRTKTCFFLSSML